ncbi:MAG: histidine kinase [Cytophagales bacterium]|nr:histidine kinase [Cytophagales bacterium]
MTDKNNFFGFLLPALSDRKIRGLFLAGWLGLASLHTYSLLHAGFVWRIAFIDGGVSHGLLLLAWLLLGWNLRFYRPEKERQALILAWCLIYTAAAVASGYYLLLYFLADYTDYLFFLRITLPLRFGASFLLITWMTVVITLWRSLQEKIEEERRKSDAEKLAREAELYKLRQQLQPHFLFNSLNSVSALVGARPAEARTMIHQLSDFLRGTLKREDEQWISLAEELDHLQLYLSIEKVRFGHRLATEIACDENCDNLQLPPLILQPVVENAIKFGLYDTTEAVTISVKAGLQNRLLEISVQNPFDPQTAAPRHGTGFGLSSVQRRLFLLFGRNDLLQTKSEDSLFTTTIRIPQP